MDESNVLFVLIPLIMVSFFVAWVWAIWDAVRHTDAEWDASGQRRVNWVLLIVFLQLLGLIAYLTIARPRLEGRLNRLNRPN
jgi:Phospholipase_D-nuclease N-terminal